MTTKHGNRTIYKVGETYKLDNNKPLELYKNGFHYCNKLEDVQGYYYLYPTSSDRLFEIEVLGDILKETISEDLSCTNEFKIVREISKDEIKSHLINIISHNIKALYNVKTENLSNNYILTRPIPYGIILAISESDAEEMR
jgi:hypothetical protein